MGDPIQVAPSRRDREPGRRHRRCLRIRARKNRRRHRYQSAVPVPVSLKAKPSPKVTLPDPKAIPIPSRDAKLKRPSPAAVLPDKWRASQKDLRKPVDWPARPARRSVRTISALAAAGRVGRQQFHLRRSVRRAYCATLLAHSPSRRSTGRRPTFAPHNAPVVGVAFTLPPRRQRVTGIRITQ